MVILDHHCSESLSNMQLGCLFAGEEYVKIPLSHALTKREMKFWEENSVPNISGSIVHDFRDRW